MCCVGPLEVAQYPLDLALLGQGNSQIEMESDDVAIEIGGGQQAAELIHGTASTRGRSPRLNNATSATRPAPASSKLVGSGAPGYTVGTGRFSVTSRNECVSPIAR